MKLILLALALCGACLAAPRSNFLEDDQLVPEELAQVGLSSNVANLKKQFHELQMQLKDGAEITPGVKKTIDQMIDMVTQQIQPAINQAHADDQEDLNTQMDGIAQLNNGLTTEVKLVNDQADVVRKMIDQEQADAAAWDAAATKFTNTQNDYLKTYDKQTDTCCQRDNSAVIDRQYTPAFVTCDYKVPAGASCSADARKAVASIVTTPFTTGLTLYKDLHGRCSGLTHDLGLADQSTAKDIKDCAVKKSAEKAASKLAASNQARVQKMWDEMITAYNGNYTVKNTAYMKSKGEVQGRETDRKAEWKATHQIKCMLRSYQKKGTFNKAVAKECNAGLNVKLDIGYPKEIKQLFPKLKPFEKQTDTSNYEHVCDARTPAPAYSCVKREVRPKPHCSPYDLEAETKHA